MLTLTQKTYERHWSAFERFAAERGASALPASSPLIVCYLADKATSVPWANQALGSIRCKHIGAGLPVPRSEEITATVRAIGRLKPGGRNRKHALTPEEVCRLVDACDTQTLQGSRDRAILLLGMDLGFRRADLAALLIGDLLITPDHVSLRDPDDWPPLSISALTEPDYCTVYAVRDWLASASLTEGPLFRSINRHGTVLGPFSGAGRAVAAAVKRQGERAGFDPRTLAAESLRREVSSGAWRAIREGRARRHRPPLPVG